MAKSRRSRRARREETKIQVHPPAEVTPRAPAKAPVEPDEKETHDFAQDYYYVYTELRNVTIIAVLMFALMFGLGYFI